MSTTTAAESPAPASEGLLRFKPRILHVAYHVADIDRALAFYVGVLGMKEQLRMALGNGVHEVVLTFRGAKGMGLILMWDEQKSQPYALGEGYSRLVLRVSDLAAAMAHLKDRNTRIVKDVQETPVLNYALIQDPDGYVLELLQMKRR